MGGLEKKQKIARNAGDIVERKKKKKKKRKNGVVIAKTREAFQEAGSAQVASSLDLTSGSSAIIQREIKKKKRMRCLSKCDLPSDEHSSEKEKQSLRAWVEMSMEPPCNNNSRPGLHGDIGIGSFVKQSPVRKPSNGHTHSVTMCFGNDTSGRICNGDAFVAAHANDTCDHVPNAHSSKVDQFLPNGQNCQSNQYTERICTKLLSATNCTKCVLSNQVFVSAPEKGSPIGSLSRDFNGETSVVSRTSTYAHCGRSFDACCRYAECECSSLAGSKRGLLIGQARSGEDHSSYHVLDVEISNDCSLSKGDGSVSVSNSVHPHNKKRKQVDDQVLQYVLKRSIVTQPPRFKPLSNKCRTKKTMVIAWGRNIPVTLTSEACTVQEWISSQSGNLFGLDVEWRPNRAKDEKNKVALLQLCNESECLIIQMLFLDRKPQALCTLLSDPLKSLAGVGILADCKRLLHDYGLECHGGVELTTLAVERLKRCELRNVGLKSLMQEVLGLKMDKPKNITLSNWSKPKLDRAQIKYACLDAWASFALSHKLLMDM